MHEISYLARLAMATTDHFVSNQSAMFSFELAVAAIIPTRMQKKTSPMHHLVLQHPRAFRRVRPIPHISPFGQRLIFTAYPTVNARLHFAPCCALLRLDTPDTPDTPALPGTPGASCGVLL